MQQFFKQPGQQSTDLRGFKGQNMKNCKLLSQIGSAIAIPAVIGALAVLPVSGVTLRDGKVYFVQPPRLVRAATTNNGVRMWGATYYFTISLPENADEPLEKVTITQRSGWEFPRFYLEESRAFEGTSRRGRPLALKAVTRDKKARTISVTFSPPVPPGRTLTIRLRPVQNPRNSGIYMFGVTAFPPGDRVHGQFLGFARFHFYESIFHYW